MPFNSCGSRRRRLALIPHRPLPFSLGRLHVNHDNRCPTAVRMNRPRRDAARLQVLGGRRRGSTTVIIAAAAITATAAARGARHHLHRPALVRRGRSAVAHTSVGERRAIFVVRLRLVILLVKVVAFAPFLIRNQPLRAALRWHLPRPAPRQQNRCLGRAANHNTHSLSGAGSLAGVVC